MNRLSRKGVPRKAVFSLEDRFWPKVDVRGRDECWPWLAALDDNGYGVINLDRAGHPQKAHRVSLMLAGFDVRGKVVRHRCDNPICVNPRHLLVGTQADNIADMHERGRSGVTGSRSHIAKLNEAQVGEILLLASLGVNNVRLGRAFGVCTSNISVIVQRKSWKHVAAAEELSELGAAIVESLAA